LNLLIFLWARRENKCCLFSQHSVCCHFWGWCLCRFGAASKTFSTLLHLLTDSEFSFSEKCVVPVPSIVNVYVDCIAAHVEAALYDEALILCDMVLSKCSSSLLDDALLQSQCSVGDSPWSVESTASRRKRLRSGSSATHRTINRPVAAQIALYKTEALLQLGRTDDALLSVDRLVYLVQVALMHNMSIGSTLNKSVLQPMHCIILVVTFQFFINLLNFVLVQCCLYLTSECKTPKLRQCHWDVNRYFCWHFTWYFYHCNSAYCNPFFHPQPYYLMLPSSDLCLLCLTFLWLSALEFGRSDFDSQSYSYYLQFLATYFPVIKM